MYCRKCGNELPMDAKFCLKCGTSVAIEQKPSAPSAPVAPAKSGLNLAFWGERFVAWLIDAIIVGLVVGLLGVFAWFASGSFTWWSNWPSWLPFFNFNLSGVIYFLYWMLMDGAYGRSIGKMVMRLRVVRLEGGQLNLGNAAVESVGKAFFLPLDFLIGLFLYPKRRQRVFNYLSRTVVIRES